MDGAIEIYSNLIIAILTFIAPIASFSLLQFHKWPTLIERQLKEMEEQNKKIEEMETMGTGYNQDVVKNSSKNYQFKRSHLEKTLELLTPENQVLNLFSMLTLSLLFLIIFKFIEKDEFSLAFLITKWCILLASFISFIIALNNLKKITWAMIFARRLHFKYKTAKNVKSLKSDQ